MDTSDFRILDAPRPERSRELFEPENAPAFREIDRNEQSGYSTRLATSSFDAMHDELEIDTLSNSSLLQDVPVPTPFRRLPASASKFHQRTNDIPRPSYFSALTQKSQDQGRDAQSRPLQSGHIAQISSSQNSARRSGEVISFSKVDRTSKLSGNQSNHSQARDVDTGFRGIQDAIATKFEDLEKKLQFQEQEITELRFSLNDANVTVNVLDTEKRQLKQKNEDLERKLKSSNEEASDLRRNIQKCQDCLEKAISEQDNLRHCVEKASEKAEQDQKSLIVAHNEVRDMRLLLEESRRELREATSSAIERHNQVTESVDAKVADLVRLLQRRDSDMQKLQDINKQLVAQLDDIPEKNLQVLTTCVKKILGKLDDAQSEILTNGKTANQQHQAQHEAMVECLKGLLTASEQHVEALATSQQETEVISKQLLERIEAYDCARSKSETSSRSELQSAISSLDKSLENSQAYFTETIASKIRESDALAELCQQRENDNKNLSAQLSEQFCLSHKQLQEIQQVYHSLRKLEETPRESPEMVAKVLLLQEQSQRFEAEIKEKDTQITRLEESYKERTKALIFNSEKFAADLQQLTSTFHQREEEYRRAVDNAFDLATKETNRTSEENKQEIQRELQQERAKRQSLEKELRQANEVLSVTEEKSRRYEQSNEKLQKELAETKVGGQVATTRLEEKTQALEHQLDHDSTVITQLKATLADKEMDYANLRSSMEAYDEKVHVLIEHLRGWAQDYNHISAIRSRLDMLSQIDQSCAATARIREAEQIDSVLAQLRRYYARQNERDQVFDFGAGKLKSSSVVQSSDGNHEQHVSDLSAFLDAEVAGRQAPSHVGREEAWRKTTQATALDNSTQSLKTPGTGLELEDSSIKPPPVLKDSVITVVLEQGSGMDPSSPPVVSSLVLKRSRLETRARIAQKTAMRNPVSPTSTKTVRRSKRKRPTTDTGRADAIESAVMEPIDHYTETSAYFQGGGEGQTLPSANGAGKDVAATANSPPILVKTEGQ